MELDVEEAPARGLRCYVALVAQALGLTGPGWTVQFDPPVSAYLALEQHHPEFPGCETALLWHERHGWALVVEPRDSGDLTAIDYLGVDVLPAPATVAWFVTRAMGRSASGRHDHPPHLLGDHDPDDLPRRLAGYAAPPRERAVRDVACTEDGAVHAPAVEPGAVRVELRTEPVATVLSLTGEVDLTTEGTVWEAICAVLAERPAVLVIDLSEVPFFGSAGLNVLVRAQQACGDTELRVVAATRVTDMPLHVTGLDTVLAVYPALQAALYPASGTSTAAMG